MLDALHSILFYRLPSYVNPVEGPLEHPHTECNFYNKNTIPPDLSFEAVVSNTAMPVCSPMLPPKGRVVTISMYSRPACSTL